MSEWRQTTLRYAGALALTVIAWLVWSKSPALAERPFILFIAAVVMSARFLGFGPGVLCTISSVVIIDYFVLPPIHAFAHSPAELVELGIFVAVAVLTASLAQQRSKAEMHADQTRRHLASIVENSQDAILSKDLDGVITSWNQGAERLYGYTAEEAIGQHVSLIAPRERPDEIPRIMRKLRSGERIQHYLTERVRKDGTRLTVYLSISPIMNHRGEITGASAIAQDVTAQRLAEEALRKTEKLATAGRMAATIAHEINNPLEAIGNLLYLARHDKEKADQYLELAEKEVQRVANIAQQTLGLVRETASALPVNLDGLLKEVLDLYSKRISVKKIEVELLSDGRAEVRGLSGELRQVFSNLIGNAIDAMPAAGRLRMRVERSRERSNARRPGVRVTVADTGSGIAPEHTQHIFEPFFTTKKDTGTGLGLWLSYSIVQKHGGSIRFRSRTMPEKSGTVFSVFLPEVMESPSSA